MTRRILFLFNHDAAHQVAHSVGVMREYALSAPEHEVVAMVRDAEMAATISAMVGPEAAARIMWHELSLPNWERKLLAPLNLVAPVYRIARLRKHLGTFAGCDMVVSTERTCLWVKRRLGVKAPRFVFIPHGAGDRNVSYHPALSGFDLMLVSGQKVADEMVRQGVTTPEQIRITGYPKFDTVNLSRRVDPFGNGAPVFLYNPHFDPLLSSWYVHGNQLIEAFRSDPSLGNLIVAPHVMLFRKKLHYSLEYRRMRVRPDVAGLPSRQQTDLIAPNIFVDLASPALFDMSYTLSADAYIGDASSQIYEFLIRPRACYFLDTRGLSATCDPANPPADARFWLTGRVFRDTSSLLPALRQWREDAAAYRAVQTRLFEETMSEAPLATSDSNGGQRLSACGRAAKALFDYAQEIPQRANK